MPPKTKQVAKGMKKAVDKVVHPPYLKTNIAAGEAAAAPPLGPQLGQRGIQIGPFCKQFNEQTKDIKPGTPIPTFVRLNPDRSTSITTYSPPTTYFLKMAAGARKGSTGPNDKAGKVTLKHIYEIAKLKIKDPYNRGESMENVCKQIIGTAHSLRIEVVKSLDPKEYGPFLHEREERLQKFEQELEEERKAKLLRL